MYIGIDNGTQGTKCAVYSRKDKQILASAYRPHSLISNEAGRREQEPRQWLEAASEALDECLADQAVCRRDVVAMAVSGQQHGMVALDKDGKVLRPAKLWCDTETVAQCREITSRMGGDEAVVAAIGNRIAAGFTASKILWLQQNEPENYHRIDCILLPHDYLNFWLTGERVTECGDASGTAYFDVRERKWSTSLLRAIDDSGFLEDRLPEIVAANAPAGRLRPALAERFDLPRGVIVAAGGGDNMMAAIGTGNIAPGVVTASLGTSGTIYACAEQPVIDPEGELAAFCSSSGGWLPLICTMNVTVATELTRELLGLDVKSFDQLVAEAEPGAGGLLWLPYFNGERTPPLPRARAALGGLSATNMTRANICRAAMEGATLGLRYGLDILRRLKVFPSEIRLVGGGANSPVWRQMAADIFNCPVVCPSSAEAGVMGCVAQAIWCRESSGGNELEPSRVTDEVIRLDDRTRVAPNAATAARYQEIGAGFRAFNDTMAPTFAG